uniref:Uncharacterized protein n=1 Tax=Aegilops tauschii subsp. strangulata TaxID=200361 RepID=A0A453NKD0_AEGTS
MYIERKKETMLPFCKKILPRCCQQSTEAISQLHICLNSTRFFAIGLGFP